MTNFWAKCMLYLQSGNSKQQRVRAACELLVSSCKRPSVLISHTLRDLATFPAKAGSAISYCTSQGGAASLTAIHPFVPGIKSSCKLVKSLLTWLACLYTTVLSPGKGTPAQRGLSLKRFNYARNTNMKPQLNYVFVDEYCLPGGKIHNSWRIQRTFNRRENLENKAGGELRPSQLP